MKDDRPIPKLPPLPQSVLAGRIPSWRVEQLEHRACPVCGEDRPDAICRRPDGLVAVRCTACGMGYLPDIPGEEDLRAFYRDYGAYKQILNPRPSWLYRLSPVKPVDPNIEILLQTGGLRGRRLCEIGCSFGGFLRRARSQGASVSGVELDEQALAELRRLGIPAGQTLPVDLRFDVVCAFQVIEHLARPEELIEQASRALSNDGRLLIALPNGGEADLVGPAWIGYRVDLEHLNYFSVLSLGRLLTRHALFIENFWECLQPNVPRAGEASESGRGLAHRMQEFLVRMTGQSYASEGSFNLVVMARKVPDPT